MVFSADNLTLPDVFKLYDPPEIQTGRVQRSTPGASASTRAPSTVLGTIFSCLPNDTLSITHNPGILVSLSTLLNESWSDLSKHRVNGSEWDMKFTLDEHQASIAVIRGEVVDLAAVFESFLFQVVNYTASRQAALLKAEAYPSIAARTSWGPSVQGGGLRGADVSASLRRDGIHSVVREIDRVVMERKGPASLSMDIILGGIRTALAGGFKIRRRSDGTYLTHEDVDTSFMHALLQVRV